MTLKQILYVRAVSKAGSIGKAAEALFISQSSLSESIQNLEREYDMVLFERTSRGISLTRQGEEFLKDTQPQKRARAFLRIFAAPCLRHRCL